MQELNPEEVKQVGGGLSMYYTPPPPTGFNANTLGDIQAGSQAAGAYDNPFPLDWNV